jgi:lipopolysaccharide export LptBFGC system permease protein LptF
MERGEKIGRLVCYMALTVVMCVILGASFANMCETGYPTERAVWGTNLTLAAIGLILLNLKNT